MRRGPFSISARRSRTWRCRRCNSRRMSPAVDMDAVLWRVNANGDGDMLRKRWGSGEPSRLRLGGRSPPRSRKRLWSAAQAVEESFELPAADRVLQLAHGFGLDLTDALAGHFEDAADFFQRVGVTV